jgi:antitoxin (DNA-binding transcriptional repressor) of toxin-antitoxin stability system
MRVVNMLEAKSTLSRLIEALESGRDTEILIARNGKPAARLTLIEPLAVTQRLGVAKGAFVAPTVDEADDAAVADLLTGDDA